MPARKYNITVEQGATFTRDLYFHDSATPPVAISLNGRSYRGMIRSAVSGPDLLDFTFVVQDQSAAGDTGRGHVSMNLSASDTLKLAPGAYVYDVFQTLANGTVEKLIKGTLTVEASVTR